MTRTIKRCTKCGAEFETSRTGYTVKCPACRAARRERRAAGGARRTGAGPTFVAHAGRTCTARHAMGVCGKPAVVAFTSRFGAPGEVFAECAEHRA